MSLIFSRAPEFYERDIKDWRDYDQEVIEVIPKRLSLYQVLGRSNVSYLDVLNVTSREAYRFYELDTIDETHPNYKSYWE